MGLSSKAGIFTIDFAPKSPLEGAVYSLNARAKQAFFGAARRNGVIARGTWNGCAFNAGSLEVPGVNIGVRDVEAAAAVFGVTPFTVTKFISAWDGSASTSFTQVVSKTRTRKWDPNPDYMESDKEATERLSELILRAGLFSDHPTFKFRVYDAQEVAAITEFKKELDDGKILEGLVEAEQLLCPA